MPNVFDLSTKPEQILQHDRQSVNITSFHENMPDMAGVLVPLRLAHAQISLRLAGLRIGLLFPGQT